VVRLASERDGSIVRTADRTKIFDLSRSAKSSESALNSGIPVYSIFTHTSDFVQNEAKILTISSSSIILFSSSPFPNSSFLSYFSFLFFFFLSTKTKSESKTREGDREGETWRER
jgi:hypothetical protein